MRHAARTVLKLDGTRGAAAAWAAALLLAGSPARALWIQQTSGTSYALMGVHFVDPVNGYAVGGNGVILKTTDGGANWTNVQPASTNLLYGVHFPVDASTGYAVGVLGKILKTVNGGSNWTTLTPPVTPDFRSVYFLDNLTGYVGGTGGAVLKTTDGGDNWTDVSIAGASNINDFRFPVAATTGWVAAADAVYKTVNGGTSWTNVEPAPGTDWHDSVYFQPDGQTGFTVGEISPGQVYKTINGGSSWTSYDTEGTSAMYDVAFADATTGYALSAWNLVHKTTDGGQSWTTQYTGQTVTLQRMCVVDALTVYVVGSGGTILKTSNGGGTGLVMHPTANGTENSFTTTTGCGGGSEWDCVNDQTGNASSGYAASVDTATRVRDNTGNTNREMYALANGLVPAGSVVRAIEIRAYLDKSGANPGVALSYQRVGYDAVPVDSGTLTITSGSVRSAAWRCMNWTPAEIDALEIGLKHLSGGAILMSQIYVVVTYSAPAGPTSGTNYRSIGTGGTIYNTGNVTVSGCTSSVATFGGGASLPANVGLGDKLVIGGSTYYIWSRDSATQVTLQAPNGGWTNVAYSIQRAYSTLQAWEDDRDGNLVGESRSEVGICYNEGAFTSPLTISGSTTDATHFMKLTVAPGQRHNGLKNTGARIDALGGWGGTDAITVEDEWTQIEWLEIKGIQDSGDGIYFDDSPTADNSTVSKVLVHSCLQSGGNAGVRLAAQNIVVRNCFFTGGTAKGVALEGSATGSVENCTIVGDGASGSGVQDAVGTAVVVLNTISVNHPASSDFVFSGTVSWFGYNMYQGVTGFDPADYQGFNQTPPADLENLLVSLATEDYHLESNGHLAGGTGYDGSLTYTDDIDGQVRLLPWDLGADDDQSSVPTTGGGGTTPRIATWKEVSPY